MDSLTELYNEISSEEEIFSPKRRPPEKKGYASRPPKTHIEELLANTERSILWINKSLIRDRRAFYASAYKCLKEKGESSLASRLEWIRGKNNLHPWAAIKVLLKK